VEQFPPDARASDLVHWQVRLAGASTGAVLGRLRGAPFALVSPGVIALPDGRLGCRRGVLLRDPDGHARQAIER
jgi:hypothetical protein